MHARQVLDSRGNPTVEVDVLTDTGAFGRAAVPSGASTGSHEAVERRDGGSAYGGKAVEGAVASVNSELAAALAGHDVHDQRGVDRLLCEVDGTADKGRVGANGVLGVSLAVAKASAVALGLPLWRSLGGPSAHVLPVPMMNVINGGAHADNALDLQEFMVVPHGAESFADALRIGSEVYHALKARLHRDGLSTAVGDEGGFAPGDLLGRGRDRADPRGGGRRRPRRRRRHRARPGDDRALPRRRLPRRGTRARRRAARGVVERACAGSTRSSRSRTRCPRTTGTAGGCSPSSSASACSSSATTSSSPIPCASQRASSAGVANAILVKVNQIGTLSEALDAIALGARSGYCSVISHRSGETEDATIADIAVATNAGQIKTGAPCRSERVAKYNQLLRIEEQLGPQAAYPGLRAFAGRGT